MLFSLRKPAFETRHPHVRQIQPWRDGRQLAQLFESAFTPGSIDDSGHRMIDMLRNYGQYEPMSFGFGSSFVWVEDGHVLGNASIQRNPTRRDTWIVGNVATETSQRNRGIGQAVIEACVDYARTKGAQHIALQVDRENAPAIRLYDKTGFARLGEVTYYIRPSVRVAPCNPVASDAPIREARWSDREPVWDAARDNIDDALTFAEPFDAGVYKLGLRWSVVNGLSGNPEKWWVLNTGPAAHLKGAVRTRVNIEGSNHHLELMLRPDADAAEGAALVETGLQRFADYISKPVNAAQSRPHEASHAALQLAGFRPLRNLVHMKLSLS
jgi:RimJ/RimL family protein N-acetyltransferase